MAYESLEFEKALEDYLPSSQSNGEIVKGMLIRKDQDYAYLDINNKKEGRIKLSELNNLEINEELEVQVLREDEDYIIVSYLSLRKQKVLEKLSVGDILEGRIIKSTKMGYVVRVDVLDVNLPYSQSGYKKDASVIGKEVTVMVKSKNGKRVNVSRIAVIEKENSQFFDKYTVGNVVEGKISKILDFGAVVSLGQINAFIHISEISWKNVNNISDYLKIGQKRVFKIIDLNKEEKNVKLSLKQIEENPWDIMRNKYKMGDIVEGKIKMIFDFGVLIDLDNNEEVFMHISDVTCRKISDINAIYKIGDSVKAKIINFNDEKQRVQVSAKVLLEEVLNNISNVYSVGQIVKGRVINVQDYGIFVELDDKVEVFIHQNEYTWSRDEKVTFKLDDIVEFKLIKVDSQEKKLSGSIKELTKSPFDEATEVYDQGDRLKVVISDIIEAGALVPLTEKFKALIPKKELSLDFVKNASDVVNVGDEVEVIVLEIDSDKKSIILSIRQVQLEQEETEEETE